MLNLNTSEQEAGSLFWFFLLELLPSGVLPELAMPGFPLPLEPPERALEEEPELTRFWLRAAIGEVK